MKCLWKALGVLKAAILIAAALVSVHRRDTSLFALFAGGLLALNAAGLRWGLEAGKRIGAGRSKSAALTVLLGSIWWSQILAQDAPRGDSGPRRDSAIEPNGSMGEKKR